MERWTNGNRTMATRSVLFQLYFLHFIHKCFCGCSFLLCYCIWIQRACLISGINVPITVRTDAKWPFGRLSNELRRKIPSLSIHFIKLKWNSRSIGLIIAPENWYHPHYARIWSFQRAKVTNSRDFASKNRFNNGIFLGREILERQRNSNQWCVRLLLLISSQGLHVTSSMFNVLVFKQFNTRTMPPVDSLFVLCALFIFFFFDSVLFAQFTQYSRLVIHSGYIAMSHFRQWNGTP